MAFRYPSELWSTEDVRSASAGEEMTLDRACVKLSASDTIVKTTADTDVAVGILKMNDTTQASGEQIEYFCKGELVFVAGGAIAINDPLCPDDGTAGRVRKAVSGDRVIGYAMEAASGAGVYCLGRFDFGNNTLLA